MAETELKAYYVGDHDYYAATSLQEAIQLHNDLIGDPDLVEGHEDDSGEVDEATLDKRWVSCDTKEDIGSMREWLAEATEPGWLAGTE
jgi:hypothetical protein